MLWMVSDRAWPTIYGVCTTQNHGLGANRWRWPRIWSIFWICCFCQIHALPSCVAAISIGRRRRAWCLRQWSKTLSRTFERTLWSRSSTSSRTSVLSSRRHTRSFAETAFVSVSTWCRRWKCACSTELVCAWWIRVNCWCCGCVWRRALRAWKVIGRLCLSKRMIRHYGVWLRYGKSDIFAKLQVEENIYVERMWSDGRLVGRENNGCWEFYSDSKTRRCRDGVGWSDLISRLSAQRKKRWRWIVVRMKVSATDY